MKMIWLSGQHKTWWCSVGWECHCSFEYFAHKIVNHHSSNYRDCPLVNMKWRIWSSLTSSAADSPFGHCSSCPQLLSQDLVGFNQFWWKYVQNTHTNHAIWQQYNYVKWNTAFSDWCTPYLGFQLFGEFFSVFDSIFLYGYSMRIPTGYCHFCQILCFRIDCYVLSRHGNHVAFVIQQESWLK